MSYLVLARKYRPQTFEQVVQQQHVTQTLANAINIQRVAHAILFAGPRGTGKTTVARILAKAMNCKEAPTAVPCNVCRSCREITAGSAVDVFEIDGASNNSVDQIRELRDNVQYLPAHSPCKIYIIDEVHMLSIAAFNALLKTLEEPPAHIMFLFATTEVQKIPITILSRCQRHDFRRVDTDAMVKHTQMICEKEGYSVDSESLWMIAREAGGSVRDALSLLDQAMVCSEGDIAYQQILDILGVIDRKVLFDISEAVFKGDIAVILDVIDDIYARGIDIKKLYADLIDHLRNLLIVKLGRNVDKLVDLPAHEIEQMQRQVGGASAAYLNQLFDLLFKEESAIRLSAQPKLALEMAFVRMFQLKPALPIDVLIAKLDELRGEVHQCEPAKQSVSRGEDRPPAPSKPEAPRDVQGPQGDISTPVANEMARPAAAKRSNEDAVPEKTWARVLSTIAESHPVLGANLTKCAFKGIADNDLEIEIMGNGFTQGIIKRPKNMEIIKDICAQHWGRPIQLKLKVGRAAEPDTKKSVAYKDQLKKEALSHPLVAEAMSIYNGKVIDVKVL